MIQSAKAWIGVATAVPSAAARAVAGARAGGAEAMQWRAASRARRVDTTQPSQSTSRVCAMHAQATARLSPSCLLGSLTWPRGAPLEVDLESTCLDCPCSRSPRTRTKAAGDITECVCGSTEGPDLLAAVHVPVHVLNRSETVRIEIDPRTQTPAEEDGIIIPTFSGHFRHVSRFLRSYCLMVQPANRVTIAVVLTDADERMQFHALLVRLLKEVDCSVKIVLTDMDAVLAGSIERWQQRRGDTGFAKAVSQVNWHRLEIQFVKKVLGALHFGFRRFLLLDSEATVLKPTSFRQLFENWFAAPAYFVSENEVQLKKWPLTPGIAFSLLTAQNWKRAGVEEIWSTMGWHPNAWFIDVQHWFHKREWLEAFVEHVELVWGKPFALALSDVDGHPMEAPAILGYYAAVGDGLALTFGAPMKEQLQAVKRKLDGQFRIVNTREQLKRNGVRRGDAAGFRDTWGDGEVLFLKIRSSNYASFKKMADDPVDPVYFYRDEATAGNALHSMEWELTEIPAIANRNYMLRLVCESPHLNMSVCSNPPPARAPFDWGRCLRGDYARLAPL